MSLRLPVLLAALSCALALPVSAALAVPAGPDIPLNSTTAGVQEDPDLAVLPGGGFVAVWRSKTQGPSSKNAIVLRRFDASGAPASAEELVVTNTNTTQLNPAVASAPDGRFVVTWQTFVSPNGDEIRARAYAADGTPDPAGEVPVNTSVAGNQSNPDVAMAPDGGFVVTWETSTPSGAVMARRFATGGASGGSEITVGAAQTNDGAPRIAIEGDGAFTVAWILYSPGNPGDVLVRRYTASDAPAFDAVTVHDATAGQQDFPDIVTTSDGFTVVHGNAQEIVARRFGPSGTPLAAAVRVNAATTGYQATPRAAVAPDGSLSVIWYDAFTRVVGRRLSGLLEPLGGDLPIPVTTGSQETPGGVISFADAFVASWTGDDVLTTTGVFARRFPFDPSTPTPTPTPTPISTPAPTPPAPAPTPAAVSFTSVATLPSAKACVSRRNFRIRLRQPKGGKLASATVKVNGRTVATRKGARVTAPVDLRGLPKGRFTVTITLKLADGRTVKGSRAYRTCAPKKR